MPGESSNNTSFRFGRYEGRREDVLLAEIADLIGESEASTGKTIPEDEARALGASAINDDSPRNTESVINRNEEA